MKKNLPVYEFLIDDTQEAGVKAVSIVADPAFGSGLVTFSKEREEPKFIVFKDEQKKKKQICAGLSLIPDVPVYRFDKETGEEYNGYFSKDTIEKIVDKYHQEMLSNKVNLNHNDNAYIDAYMVEDYIVNSDQRKQDLNAMGIDHKNIMGAWYTAFKIKDPQVFQNIEQSGKATGFSVEAYLEKFMTQFDKQVLNKIINNKVQTKMKKVNKTLKEKILAIFTEIEKFERALVPELAFEIEWTEVGAPVNKVIVDQNGNETLQPVGQGEFNTDMGIVVVDASSNLVEVRDLPAQPAVETPEVPVASGDTSTVAAATQVADTQSGSADMPMPSGMTTTSGDTANMAAYPWDKCISDQLAKGLSQKGAEALCGWIKANNSSEEMDALAEAEFSAEDLACYKKNKMAEPDKIVASGDTSYAASGNTTPAIPKTMGINSTVDELTSGADGDYLIAVCRKGGIVTEANVSNQLDLIPEEYKSAGFSTAVKNAFAKVVELEAKMKEPMAEPVITVPVTQKEFSKMTAYEKVMYNKGMQAV